MGCRAPCKARPAQQGTPGGSAWGWGWRWPDRNRYQHPLTAHLGVRILYVLTIHYSEIIMKRQSPKMFRSPSGREGLNLDCAAARGFELNSASSL